MISLWWSFALTAAGVTGLYFVYRSQSLLGPTIGILVQLAWIAYAIETRQWWFLVSAFAYGGTNIYGIVKRRTAQAPEPEKRQPRGWMAPRAGGYTPTVKSNSTRIAMIPPKGPGGVATTNTSSKNEEA